MHRIYPRHDSQIHSQVIHRLIHLPESQGGDILCPIMFRDAFTRLDTLEIENLLPRLNPLVDGAPFTAKGTTVLSMELPFYNGYSLLEIADHSVMPSRKSYVIHGPDQVVALDWTNAPIYALNRKAPLKLNAKNAIEYLRFFFSFVRGPHGHFVITETPDDISWREDPPPAARKAIGNMIEPVRIKSTARDGTMTMIATMVFKNSLFRSMVSVTPEGLVSMRDEELMVEDLPVLDEVFGQ